MYLNLDFPLKDFFENLSKTFDKQKIYFTSFTLCTILYFNPKRVGKRGSLIKTDICFKATFLFGRKRYIFSVNLFRNILTKNFSSINIKK